MEKDRKGYTIIMVGDSGIGKTMLAQVFINGRGAFSDIYITTSGAELMKKTITLNGEKITLKIWDLSGANEYRTRITYQFNDADGIMLCFSMTSLESWDNIDNWITTIELQNGKDEFDKVEKILVGLKCDSRRVSVNDEDIVMKCSSISNAEVMLTSAKQFTNVQEAFYALITRIHNKRHPTNSKPVVHREPKRSICMLF